MLQKLPAKKKYTPQLFYEFDEVKFLVDQCTGIFASEKLRQMNFDSVSVIESMREGEDEEIVKKAVEEGRVLLKT